MNFAVRTMLCTVLRLACARPRSCTWPMGSISFAWFLISHLISMNAQWNNTRKSTAILERKPPVTARFVLVFVSAKRTSWNSWPFHRVTEKYILPLKRSRGYHRNSGPSLWIHFCSACEKSCVEHFLDARALQHWGLIFCCVVDVEAFTCIVRSNTPCFTCVSL